MDLTLAELFLGDFALAEPYVLGDFTLAQLYTGWPDSGWTVL